MTPIRCIVADPPWRFSDRLTMSRVKRGAASNYATMGVDEIKAFPMPLPMADDALLFLWRVGSMQQEALDVMRAWGFTPKSEIVWVKTTRKDVIAAAKEGAATASLLAFGMGRYVRNCHEVCLIGRRGRGAVKNHSTRSVFFAPAGRHSEKPNAFFELVEALAPGPRMELFARRHRPGWRCFGNEVEAA